MPQPITGPLPVPSPDGIRAARGLGVVENPSDPLDPDERWTTGYAFRRQACKGGEVLDPCAPDDLTPTRGPGTRTGMPFLLSAERTCSTFGWAAADYSAEAQRLLDLVQYDQIGRELWRDGQAQASGWDNIYFARDSDPNWLDLVTAAGGNPTLHSFAMDKGLAAMEEALAACTVGRRVIHAPRSVVTYWDLGGALRWEGGRIFTITGTQVITDTGYDGSGPDSLGNPVATPAGIWIYGTGVVLVRVQGQPALFPAPDDMATALDRRTNDLTFVAQKLAMATWDCCHIGARLSLDPVAP